MKYLINFVKDEEDKIKLDKLNILKNKFNLIKNVHFISNFDDDTTNITWYLEFKDEDEEKILKMIIPTLHIFRNDFKSDDIIISKDDGVESMLIKKGVKFERSGSFLDAKYNYINMPIFSYDKESEMIEFEIVINYSDIDEKTGKIINTINEYGYDNIKIIKNDLQRCIYINFFIPYAEIDIACYFANKFNEMGLDIYLYMNKRLKGSNLPSKYLFIKNSKITKYSKWDELKYMLKINYNFIDE